MLRLALILFFFPASLWPCTKKDLAELARGPLTTAERELKNVNGPPAGKLTLVRKLEASSAQSPSIYRDEAGVEWFAKSDQGAPELQTRAEVIASKVYRHFGIYAPETHIADIEGKTHSVSKLMPEGRDVLLREEMPNESRYRTLKVLVSFLRDKDRLQVGPNNRQFADGSVALYDFGGTLGSRAGGLPKQDGSPWSAAIGTLSENPPIAEIFPLGYASWVPANHPWHKMTRDDVTELLGHFRTLDEKRIGEIVDRAKYSRREDAEYMKKALLARRNTILRDLETHLGY